MSRSSLCDHNDAYILVKETVTVENKAAEDQPNNVANIKVIFKNCTTFNNCIGRTNNTQVDDTLDIDVVISMYNLIEYSNKYSKIS